MNRRMFAVVALVAVLALLFAPAMASAAELAGTVKAVDAAKMTVTVTDDTAKDNVVTYTETTVVTKADGTPGKAADVKAGSKVKVTHTGGKASKIDLQP